VLLYEDFLNFRKQKIEEHQYLDYKSGEILVGHQGQWIGKDGKLTTDKGFLKLAAVVAGFANAEDSFTFLKTCLEWEEVQVLDWQALRTLVALAWVAAGFLYGLGGGAIAGQIGRLGAP